MKRAAPKQGPALYYYFFKSRIRTELSIDTIDGLKTYIITRAKNGIFPIHRI